MAVSITIEDIPDDTMAILLAQAIQKRLTLEDYLLEWLINRADEPYVEAGAESR